MRLLDKPFDSFDKEDSLRSLKGCINRICVSEDPLEIVRMVGFANDYIAMLAQSRMMQLEEDDNV